MCFVFFFTLYRSYSTLSIASSRSSLASDLHDVGTPPPSSPLPTTNDSKDTPTPAPTGNSSEGREKRHSRSATPQPHPSQPQGNNGETGVSQDSAKAPEISVQGPESEQTTTQPQLSLEEAGSQVEDFVVVESASGVEAVKKDDDFGDFQGAVGEGTGAAIVPTTQSSDSVSPSEAVVGDVSQASPDAEAVSVSQGEVHQEGGPSADVNSTAEASTNLPQSTPDTATSTGMCHIKTCMYSNSSTIIFDLVH